MNSLMENNQENYVEKKPEEIASTSGGGGVTQAPKYAPGYRFVPKDEELIVDYLMKKINDQPIPLDGITQVILYQHSPQVLADTHPPLGEKEWYFFTPRDRKYQNGSRPSRSAGNGYWKATGSDRSIKFMGKIVGFKKSLVFHEGRPPAGNKTNWIMHEYRANQPARQKTGPSDMRLDDWVLCRIYLKSETTKKMRKRNDGNEEELEDKEEEEEEKKVVAKKPAKNNVSINNVDTPVLNNATNHNTFPYPHQIIKGTAYNNSWPSNLYFPENYDHQNIREESPLVYYDQHPNYILEPNFAYMPNQMTSFASSSMQSDMNSASFNLPDVDELTYCGHHHSLRGMEDTSLEQFSINPYHFNWSHYEPALPPDIQDQENLRQLSSPFPLSSGLVSVEDPTIKPENSSEDPDYNQTTPESSYKDPNYNQSMPRKRSH